MRMLRFSRVWLLVSTLILCAPVTAAPLLQTIDFQLRWHHQFQFAGYYAAVEKGFYRDEGLDVRLHEAGPGITPVEQVLTGKAQYAESNSEILYARMHDKPVVALAAIFQHSPSVLLARKDAGILTPHDLVGKKIMLLNSTTDADFRAMFLREGIKQVHENNVHAPHTDAIEIVPCSYDVEDLISGKVKAFNSYLTNEPYILNQRGIEYTVISPSNYGIDFYSDILFTTEQELKDHPERVEAMRRATLKGWHYAMDHPDEIIELLLTKYKIAKSREHLKFEADTMRSLILPDLIEIGHMNPGRWQRMADSFIDAGMGNKHFSLDGFLYDPTPKQLPKWVAPAITAPLIALTLVTWLALYLFRLNRQLSDTKDQLSLSEERSRLAMSAATQGWFDLDLRTGGVLLGPEYPRILGFDPAEMSNSTLEQWQSNLHPEDREAVLAAFKQCLDSDDAVSMEYRRRHKNGKWVWLRSVGKITERGPQKEPIRMIGIHTDITPQKLAERQLRLAASIWETSSEAVLVTDADNKIISVNPAFTAITGYQPEEVLGQNPKVLGSGMHSNEFYQELWSDLYRDGIWAGEIHNRRKDGSVYVEWLSIKLLREKNGEPLRHVAIFSDISDRKAAEKHLERLAHYDFLTGLPNRTLFDDRLQQSVAIARRERGHAAVLFLDLDNFKPVNDNHGHHIGDLLLRETATRLLDCVRESDTVCRLGGDEFVILLPAIDGETDATTVAEKIRLSLSNPFTIQGITVQVSTSIGVAIYPHHGDDEEKLLKSGDAAMYVAKKKGRNTTQIYDPSQSIN